MSSIIKGGRTRNQGIMNLSERLPQKAVVEEVYEEVIGGDEEIPHEMPHITSTVIEEKKEELRALEEQIACRMAEANQKVDQILNEGYTKAAQFEADAKSQQTAIISAAYEKEQLIIKNAEETASRMKEEAVKEKEQMLSSVEGEVVDTMITLLQHIISDELQYNEDWLIYIVRKMLQKPNVEEGTTLFVSPKHYEALEGKQEIVLQELRKLSQIKIDESLNDATCKLVTSQGNIEYDVNQGLDKVISELRILKSLS